MFTISLSETRIFARIFTRVTTWKFTGQWDQKLGDKSLKVKVKFLLFVVNSEYCKPELGLGWLVEDSANPFGLRLLRLVD